MMSCEGSSPEGRQNSNRQPDDGYRDVRRDSKEFRMVELILDIAAFLKVPVIAEGVETEEQIGMLKQAGCELVQGFYSCARGRV